jgi:hypothetical protein
MHIFVDYHQLSKRCSNYYYALLKALQLSNNINNINNINNRKYMLNSQLEIVEQAKQFLSAITQSDYVEVVKPHMAGSAGAHIRHILDHYFAIKLGLENGVVDYNKRNRYSSIETDLSAALQAWSEIETWLEYSCGLPMNTPLDVVSETSIKQTQNIQVPSTLARELVFVSSHAVHHFSLLAVVNSLVGRNSPENFGIAPASVTFARQQA